MVAPETDANNLRAKNDMEGESTTRQTKKRRLRMFMFGAVYSSEAAGSA